MDLRLDKINKLLKQRYGMKMRQMSKKLFTNLEGYIHDSFELLHSCNWTQSHSFYRP